MVDARMTRFSGKVVIVTGAGSGIGRAAALAFALEGAHVIAANRKQEDGVALVEAILAKGGAGEFLQTDVTVANEMRRLIDCTAAKHGRIDILFNNAGYQEPRSRIDETPAESFDQVFHTNARSVWLGMKYALPHMLARQTGVVINCASASGLRNSNKGLSLYSASKAAVISLTKSAALEYGPAIRVNAVSPGRVQTPMMLASKIADMSLVAQSLPLKRLGKPEEVANAVLWLASDDATFVTGHILEVDGGFTAT